MMVVSLKMGLSTRGEIGYKEAKAPQNEADADLNLIPLAPCSETVVLSGLINVV